METTLYCKKCNKADLDEYDVYNGKCIECGTEVEEVCAHCLGTGEIVEDGRDSNGNIERGVESRKCPFCKSEDEDRE